MGAFSGEITQSKLFCLPSERGGGGAGVESTLKGKNLLFLAANYFLLKWAPLLRIDV